jgi:hypothetical protein
VKIFAVFSFKTIPQIPLESWNVIDLNSLLGPCSVRANVFSLFLVHSFRLL